MVFAEVWANFTLGAWRSNAVHREWRRTNMIRRSLTTSWSAQSRRGSPRHREGRRSGGSSSLRPCAGDARMGRLYPRCGYRLHKQVGDAEGWGPLLKIGEVQKILLDLEHAHDIGPLAVRGPIPGGVPG